ncbi:MAG TPA: hypothetical protein PKE66_02955 [Pyrinomonadaceae bacterium]|nr:hypothetical protein [Pyrinomonadaceae bacterium]
MNFVDLFALELHRAIAEKMLRDERAVIARAKANIARWLNSGNFPNEIGAPLREWMKILESESPANLRKLIVEQSDEGQRLRSSSPFTGILSKAEREAIMKKCAEIEPV